jgi:ribosomal protein S27AE
MQHYAELETTKLGREEEGCPEDEEDAICLQCADSLAIAAHRIGEDVFLAKHLLRSLRALRCGKYRPKLYPGPSTH